MKRIERLNLVLQKHKKWEQEKFLNRGTVGLKSGYEVINFSLNTVKNNHG